MGDNLPVALVTGSGSGIGLAIAQRLSRAGYGVALHGRATGDAGRQAARALPRAEYFSADLLVDSERRDLICQVAEHFGRLDVLVNNAGESSIIPHDDLLAASPEIWHRLYELHVVAPWQLVAYSTPYLRSIKHRSTHLYIEHQFPCRRASQGSVRTLRCQQSGADPRYTPSRQNPGTADPG